MLSTPDGEVVDEAHELLGRVTNNVAEYRGLLLGLARAQELGADEVEVVNDSELVAKQVNGLYKVKHPDMRPLHSRGDGGAARLQSAGRCARSRGPRTPTPTRSSTRPSTRPARVPGRASRAAGQEGGRPLPISRRVSLAESAPARPITIVFPA